MPTKNRLTKYICEMIVDDLMRHAFKDKAQAHFDAELAFVKEVWAMCYTKAEFEKMAALPAGWLPEDNDFKVQINGEVFGLDFATGLGHSVPYYWLMKLKIDTPAWNGENVLMPSNAARGGVIKVFDDKALWQRATDLKDAREKLEEDRQNAFRTATNTVKAVTTIPRLIEVWPEIKPFASKYLDLEKPPVQMPNVPRDQLNASLGLPVEEAA
ncbi:hypothetical protein FDH38_gp113 [Dinoroseobacter phage vB_DshS-R5C]|uniref:Nucleotide modification associated domain-containing protein n=1 Tax=Dinoroseobacter phage vB_DshS-R5C TaxID=1965368 RepID=A0A1V0DYG5_9CAUD|nr:hypothetical protein FDH38_gp113 [Dinoroseobacter phage vB_DshS-R5C]ARB06167.1 hypothetical protein vBDshSR5C_113 [Dinoroseobacter phage vB_DshS-R5C]